MQNVLAFNEVADEVVMLDVKEGVSEGKAMDMMQTAQLLGFDTTIVGYTNDYAQTANSDVVVITSGIPRKPGMTREELIGVKCWYRKISSRKSFEILSERNHRSYL